MDAATRERQVEAAWRQHEPLRARVSPEARRAVRVFKQQIAPEAARIKDVLKISASLGPIDAWSKLGPLNRERKLAKIKTALSPASVDNVGGDLLVLWLEAHGQLIQVDDPSFQQEVVLVVAAVGTRLRSAIRWTSFPVFEAPDHMLARMFQRSPGVNASAALYEAAVSFLRADRGALRFDGETLYLPAGPGLTLTLPISLVDLEGKPRLIARGFTWIAAEMATPDQRPVAAAVDCARSVLASVVRGG